MPSRMGRPDAAQPAGMACRRGRSRGRRHARDKAQCSGFGGGGLVCTTLTPLRMFDGPNRAISALLIKEHQPKMLMRRNASVVNVAEEGCSVRLKQNLTESAAEPAVTGRRRLTLAGRVSDPARAEDPRVHLSYCVWLLNIIPRLHTFPPFDLHFAILPRRYPPALLCPCPPAPCPL